MFTVFIPDETHVFLDFKPNATCAHLNDVAPVLLCVSLSIKDVETAKLRFWTTFAIL